MAKSSNQSHQLATGSGQRATPGRCQCDDKQSMAHIVEDPDAHTHTHVLAKTHSIYCCDNVPGIAAVVARVALVTTVAVAVAVAINV